MVCGNFYNLLDLARDTTMCCKVHKFGARIFCLPAGPDLISSNYCELLFLYVS